MERFEITEVVEDLSGRVYSLLNSIASVGYNLKDTSLSGALKDLAEAQVCMSNVHRCVVEVSLEFADLTPLFEAVDSKVDSLLSQYVVTLLHATISGMPSDMQTELVDRYSKEFEREIRSYICDRVPVED